MLQLCHLQVRLLARSLCLQQLLLCLLDCTSHVALVFRLLRLAIPLRAHTGLSEEVIQSIVRIKLGLVHLGGTEKKLPSELSGGMRKRAGLARSIALDPQVLICDEPTAGLDPRTAHDMDQLLLDLVRIMKMTVVVVTHERSSIKTIADRIVMLNDGVVHFHGTLEEAEASQDPELRGFFHSGV